MVTQDVVERRSGLSAADLASVHGWFDEDPARVAALDHYDDAKLGQLVTAMRARGVHVHELGQATVRELGFVMYMKEVKAQEAAFTAG